MPNTPETTTNTPDAVATVPAQDHPASPAAAPAKPKEHGGPKGPEPTRYGDWEKNGRCIDF
jgi:hypothetical protein